MDEPPLFIIGLKHDAKAAVQEKSVSSVQPVSSITPVSIPKVSASVPSGVPAPQANMPRIGSSSAADIPGSIASVSLFGATPASDADTASTQGGYGIPDKDGDNDGK